MPKNYTKFCKICRLEMLIKQLTKTHAIYICQDVKCNYNSPSTNWVVVNRSNAELMPEKYKKAISYYTKPKDKKKLSSSEVLNIEQFVDLTYDDNCEKAVYTTSKQTLDNKSQYVDHSSYTHPSNVLDKHDTRNEFVDQFKLESVFDDLVGFECSQEIKDNPEDLQQARILNFERTEEMKENPVRVLNFEHPIEIKANLVLDDPGTFNIEYFEENVKDSVPAGSVDFPKEIKENSTDLICADLDNKSELWNGAVKSKFDGFKFTSLIIKPVNIS